MTVRGYGQKGQDWSYLTPKTAIAVQSGNVVDPSTLNSEFVINTTVRNNGNESVERAREQTLVIFVVPSTGATLSNDCVLHLWSKVDWDQVRCTDAGSSSSSGVGCASIPALSSLPARNHWALIDAVKHANAVAANESVAFYFYKLPAGIYKAAIASGLTGEATIVEQHTE